VRRFGRDRSEADMPRASGAGQSDENDPNRTIGEPLFNDLVRAQQERLRDCQPERLGGRQIDDEIEFGRLLDRDVARLRPAQNLVDIVGGAPIQVGLT